jgi:fibronectin-binding autotransporter adhesin
LNRNLTITGAFTEQAGIYNDGSFTTNVTGLTTLSGGILLASTTADTFTGGLTVSGGTFTGSTGTVTTGNVTVSSGTLNAPSGTLDVTGGNFTCTGGVFNADGGTVTYSGSGTPTVSAVGTRFYNFQDALAAYPSTMTINGTLTVTGTFSVLGNARTINGNIEAQGNVDDENHGGIGNPYLTLDGNSNQTIEDLSGAGGGQFRTITINKTGGTVNLACNPTVFSGITFSAGTVNTGTYSWILGSLGPVSAASGLNLGNIEIDGAVTVIGSLQVANVTFAAASDSLKAPAGSLFVSGNWNNAVGGTFTPNGGTVVFDGTGGIQQLTSGGKSFYNLTIAVGASVILEADLTYAGAFIDNGTFNPNGHKVNGQ